MRHKTIPLSDLRRSRHVPHCQHVWAQQLSEHFPDLIQTKCVTCGVKREKLSTGELVNLVCFLVVAMAVIGLFVYTLVTS